MLIVGGAGNNLGAIAGAFLVWGFWTASGGVMRGWVPQAEQARAAALQVVLIGVLIATMLVLRPRGLLGNFREQPPGAGNENPILAAQLLQGEAYLGEHLVGPILRKKSPNDVAFPHPIIPKEQLQERRQTE